MGKMREYDIAFVGLKPGIHEYQYEVDDKFFENLNNSDLSGCKATVKVKLEKSASLILLKFDIDGSAMVNCDRCGNPLKLDLWDEFKMVIKQVENPEEMNANEEDPDIFYISHTESHLHLAEWIYEFVVLSIPNQRMCPEDEINGPRCNKEVLNMLKNMGNNSKNNSHPLKKELEKLKKNNN